MSWNRPLLWLGLSLASSCLLVWAVYPVDASRPSSPATPADATPAAELLIRAADRLQGAHLTWLETEVWQRSQMNGVSCTAHGRYVQGTGGKRRLELHTHTQGREGELLVVSDGERLWQGMRTGGEGWADVRAVRLYELGDPQAALAKLATIPAARPWFGGDPLALLANLRSGVQWGEVRTVLRQGRSLVKLSGRTEPGQGIVSGGCQCHLYLDLDTLWPYRLEWWDDGGRNCLVEIELRAPRRNEPRPEAEKRALFTFNAGATPIRDETPQAREWLGLPFLGTP